jgi:hypothetical protein
MSTNPEVVVTHAAEIPVQAQAEAARETVVIGKADVGAVPAEVFAHVEEVHAAAQAASGETYSAAGDHIAAEEAVSRVEFDRHLEEFRDLIHRIHDFNRRSSQKL